MSEKIKLSTNGLIMPHDFPVAQYEAIHKRVEPSAKKSNDIYEQFAGAWSGLSYRYLAMTEYETAFVNSIKTAGSAPMPTLRHEQERDLFAFFSNGFSVFETIFYGLFSLGAIISPKDFPMTPKDLQKISPFTTSVAMGKFFEKDPINTVLKEVMEDADYLEWREIRNILTHRAAPGRTFHVSIGSDEILPDQWKIKDIPLDENMATARRKELARLVALLIEGIDRFTQSHL